MAPKINRSLLLLAALLVSVFAAAAATGDYCYAGMGLPNRPLEGCREYVAHQTCGAGILGAPSVPIETLKRQCCLEFSQVRQHCRCEALRYLMGGASHPDASSLLALPGCPTEPQRDFARMLPTPAQCNLVTDYNTPFCLAMDEV
ncbi:hypothetical protein ACQ4PT_007951 [Festuca glaucescens]